MFRRGSPMRPRIPFLGFLNPVLQRLLGEANHAFETGDYPTAAARYTRLAERAVILGKPHAGNWFVKAGQANILEGNNKLGLDQVVKGLDILLTQSRRRDILRLAWRTVELLKENGLITDADQIVNWVQNNIPGSNSGEFNGENEQRSGNTKQQLPSKCSSCGAPVHPNTVDWVENGQAACGYCGCLFAEN